MTAMTVTFWGVRGSIPTPGRATARFGGNTSCVEVRVGEERIVLDMGSGLRALGGTYFAEGTKEITFLMSHYHWDHILGMPFFGPAYDPSRRLVVYGAERFGQGAGGALAGQMVGPYFPIDIGAMRAKLDFRLIADGSAFDVGPAHVRAAELSHPGGVLGFRIEAGGRSVVYATDFEHGLGKDEALVALSKDADLLIYDAMYTPESYERHKGWGHSTWAEGVRIAREAGVRKLALFHHEPSHDDRQVAAIEAAARAEFPGAFAAREGRTVTVGGVRRVSGPGRGGAGTSRAPRAAARAAR
jgi:phosphoribosyl 1,2-cyclic phosphodiesterase